MDPSASLRPIAGDPADVERLVTDWLAEDRPAALTVRTSGSTGAPKDVALSAAAVRASAVATLDRLGGPGQWVLALPVHYVAGLQVVVRSVLAGTSPVVLDDCADLGAAAGRLGPGRRYVALVPTQLHRMLASAASTRALAGFDAVLLGGAAADGALLAAARAAGVHVVTTYGMSETSGGCVYDGRPLDGVEVRLGSRGRVLLSGPVLFDGYVGQPALTAEVLRDGWLHTPDIGRLDSGGRLEVLGRLDDTVVSGGTNVPLGAVEARVRAHPAVAGAAVVGLPDVEWGSRVVAYVVAADRRHPPTTEQVRDFVSAIHPRAWAPREVRLLDRLPLLASGKVDRQALTREMATHDR